VTALEVRGVTFDVDAMDGRSAILQVDGNDLVHIADIDKDTGTARITVFESSHEHAEVLYRGVVNVRGHLRATGPAGGSDWPHHTRTTTGTGDEVCAVDGLPFPCTEAAEQDTSP
jgi:hypothetical protein